MKFRRGDIVWARVLFPKKWWPGLVQSIDGHKVAVSFFNDGEDPRIFLETEVFSFEEKFESLSKTLKNSSRGEKLLDSALKLLARRAAYSLKCPCNFRSPEAGEKISKRSRRRRRDEFRPEELLSLVHGLAVLPFVLDSDFVGTVTMASQLHMFRRFLVAERKVFLDLKATKDRVQSSRLPITESLNADQPNSESWIETNHVNTQSFDRVPVNMQCVSFDNNHTREGCLSIVQRNSSPIRNLGSQAISNIENNKCILESYPSNPTESLGLKRHYDHSVESDIRFKLCKTMPLSSINGIHADTERSEIGQTVCGLESLISMPSFSNLSLKFCNRMPLSFHNCTDSAVQNSSICEEFTHDSFSSESFDKVSVGTRYCLPSAARNHVSVETNRLESSNALSFRECSTKKKIYVPMVASHALSILPQIAQKSPHTIQMKQCTSIDHHEIAIENSRQYGIDTAFSSRESSMMKLVLPAVTSDLSTSMPQETQQSETAIQMDHSRDNHSIPVDNDKQDGIDAALDASSSMLLETQQSENYVQIDHSRGNHNISVKNGRPDDINEAFICSESSMKKLLLPLVTSDAPSSMSQEALQPENAIQMDHNRDNHNISFENGRQDGSNTAFSSIEISMMKLLLPMLTSDEPSSMPQEAHQSENAIQMGHSRDNCNISVKNDRQDGINAAFGSMKQLLLPLVTSDASSSIPQEAEQSENAIQMHHSRDSHIISVENGRQNVISAAFSPRESSTKKSLLPLVTPDAPSSMPQEAQQSENAIQTDHRRENHSISFENGRQDGINEAFSSRKSSMKKLKLHLVTSDASASMPHEAQQSENAIQTGHSRDNHNISVDTSRLESTNAASSFKESSTVKKPKVDEQSARTMYGSCQILYMKFPKDFSLPSKKDLVRKFRQFGKIDMVKTQVFERMGSAQVVFLHHLDALVAYLYAKRKKSLFGGATVLFWLDPHEKKKNHSKFVVAPMPELKSCIKNPHSGGQEDKKRSRKVRFLMQS